MRTFSDRESTEGASNLRPATQGSNRSFGVALTIVFVVVGLYPLVAGRPPRFWLLAVAAILLALSLVMPRLLTPLNRLWSHLGKRLHVIVTPLIMGLLFYVVVLPTGLILRGLKKDPLRLRFRPDAESYWIIREPGTLGPETMRNQF